MLGVFDPFLPAVISACLSHMDQFCGIYNLTDGIPVAIENPPPV